MTYSQLIKKIKQASKDQKESGIINYIEYIGQNIQKLSSNFLDTCKKNATPTDAQLYKAEKDGLLLRDDSQEISYDGTAYLVI